MDNALTDTEKSEFLWLYKKFPDIAENSTVFYEKIDYLVSVISGEKDGDRDIKKISDETERTIKLIQSVLQSDRGVFDLIREKKLGPALREELEKEAPHVVAALEYLLALAEKDESIRREQKRKSKIMFVCAIAACLVCVTAAVVFFIISRTPYDILENFNTGAENLYQHPKSRVKLTVSSNDGMAQIHGAGDSFLGGADFWQKWLELKIYPLREFIIGNYRDLYIEVILPEAYYEKEQPLITMKPLLNVYGKESWLELDDRTLTGKDFTRASNGRIKARLHFSLELLFAARKDTLKPEDVVVSIIISQTLREVTKDAEFYCIDNIGFGPRQSFF
jgi:hypothetical protein